jgi:hypothetical protein
MRRAPILAVCFGLLVAACSDDASGTTVPVATTAAVVTTAPPLSTTLTSMVTTTATVVTTTAAPTTTAPPTSTTVASTAAVPAGSGCAPGGDTLLAGSWFGFVEGVVMTPSGSADMTFDLACYFEGVQAVLAAAEDGRTLEDPPYVRNQNPLVFHFSVWNGAQVDDHMGGGPFSTWFVTLPADNGCSPSTGFHACPLWVMIDSAGTAYYVFGLLPEWSGDGRGS